MARGSGSIYNGHERRCLWEICNKPMVQWSLEAAKASKYVNKIVLGSEDMKILKVGEKIGGITVIPRPLQTAFHLPRDYGSGIFQRQLPRSIFSGEPTIDTNYADYCFWYLLEYESYVAHIQVGLAANGPLGTVESLDKLIEAFFLDEEATAGLSFYSIMGNIHYINPVIKRPMALLGDTGLDRQKQIPLYRPGPHSLLGRPLKSTYDQPTKYAYIIIPPEEGIDVHNKDDLELAEFYMEKRLKKKEVNE